MSTLERRYRRLLVVYPRAHRAIHEEEMVEVLLSTAAPEQRWPSIRDTADLIRGARLIWLRHLQLVLRQQGWTDALAIVAILAQILLCLISVPAAGLLLRAVLEPTVSWLTYILLTGAVLAWPVILVLSLANQKQLAAVAAWVATAVSSLAFSVQGQEVLALEVLAAMALTFSPGASRGVAVLGRTYVLGYAAGVLLVAVFLTERLAEGLSPQSMAGPALACYLFGWLLIGRTAFRLRPTANRRAAILLAFPLTAIAFSFVSLNDAVPYHVSSLLHVLLPVSVFLGLVTVERAGFIRQR
jgi:hypothetical protein